jgi:PAS domain S-box-containing protein
VPFLTLILALFCVLFSLAIYLVAAYILVGSVRSFEIFMSLLIPAIVSPPVCIVLLKMEARLRRNENSLKEAQRIAHIGNWELDLARNTLIWSDEIYRMLELNPQAITATRDALLGAVHPADREFVNQAYTVSLKTEEPYDITYRLFMPDGRTKYVHELCETFYGPDGNPLRSIGTVHDITERKHSEMALKMSEERYRGIFENSPLGIFQSTFEGRFLKANPALAAILGYESPEDLIDSISDIAAQVYANPKDRARVLLRMQENNGRAIYENEHLRKDGGKGIGHLTMRIINDENGVPHHLDGTVEDVTEKRAMEERLQRTMEQLRTLSHRLLEIQETERRYIARELHDEIGQTLTALKIGLKRTEGSRTLESALASMHENAPTVEELIHKVRNLSIELRPSILDDFGLTAALDWYVNWLSAKAGFKVVFYTDFTEERFSPILELTCFRITQEALTNAARHSEAKAVYIDLETMSGELHLTVRDDGKGFNIDETRVKALKGESFGLLGMQERASLAGGHLELTSEPGKGTVVHACFPLEP